MASLANCMSNRSFPISIEPVSWRTSLMERTPCSRPVAAPERAADRAVGHRHRGRACGEYLVDRPSHPVRRLRRHRDGQRELRLELGSGEQPASGGHAKRHQERGVGLTPVGYPLTASQYP